MTDVKPEWTGDTPKAKAPRVVTPCRAVTIDGELIAGGAA